MKRITFKRIKDNMAWFELCADEASEIAFKAKMIAKTQLFKPEREIIEFSESYDEADVKSTRQEILEAESHFIVGSGLYDEADVIRTWTQESVNELDEVIYTDYVAIQNNSVVNYVTLKAEYVIAEEDITAEYNAAHLKQQRIDEGKKARQCCEEILDFVGGYNVERALSLADIQQMQTEFADIYGAIKAYMPRTAKTLAQSASATVLVTQELLDETLAILIKFGY